VGPKNLGKRRQPPRGGAGHMPSPPPPKGGGGKKKRLCPQRRLVKNFAATSKPKPGFKGTFRNPGARGECKKKTVFTLAKASKKKVWKKGPEKGGLDGSRAHRYAGKRVLETNHWVTPGGPKNGFKKKGYGKNHPVPNHQQKRRHLGKPRGGFATQGRGKGPG